MPTGGGWRVAVGEGGPRRSRDRRVHGAGWVAEEALAIALFCALKAESFEQGVLLAVNHGGDSDSTGSMTGNLLGLLHGRSAIPQGWLDYLELRDVIEEVATDMWRHFFRGSEEAADDTTKYPGW